MDFAIPPGEVAPEVADVQTSPADPNPEVSFQACPSAPGFLHITHNAAIRVLASCSDLDEAVDPMVAVCKLIRNHQTSTRLQETCFTSPVARQFVRKLQRCKAKPHRERWGTISISLVAILELVGALRTC